MLLSEIFSINCEIFSPSSSGFSDFSSAVTVLADKVMQNILVSNPQIDAIWAADDDMALGVENALKSAGRDKNVWILGGAGMKDVVKRVMDNDPMFPGDITYPPSMIALGMQTAAGMLRGGKENSKKFMPKQLKFDVDIITPENAKDYYFPDSIY